MKKPATAQELIAWITEYKLSRMYLGGIDDKLDKLLSDCRAYLKALEEQP